MRILNFDMDFFLDKVAIGKPFDNIRLSDNEYTPWSEQEVRNFLKDTIGLSNSTPKLGAVLTHHVGFYCFIKKLILSKIISPPFDLIHIDAHADLGLGDSKWSYIYQELLAHPINERLNHIKANKVNSGNYLLFMIALEWINTLTYIPHKTEDGYDFISDIMKNFNNFSEIIQLKYYKYGINFSDDDYQLNQHYIPQAEVPFKILKNMYNYDKSLQIDYIFLSQSPSYTPKSADFIIDIFREYIDQDLLLKKI